MNEQDYMQALATIVNGYHRGELTGDEFHERIAELREKEIESWRREQERPGG